MINFMQVKPLALKQLNIILKKLMLAKKLNAFVEVYTSESIERAKYLDEKRKVEKIAVNFMA